jgi:ligand-binding SRPBCC domain-containing protein
MLYFQRSILINAPVAVVWEFHEQTNVLQLLTPPWQPVKVIRRIGGLEVGAISEFVIFLGFLPVRWLARHTECDRHHLFTDEQILGPMVEWRHEHRFTTENDRTRLTDAIAFVLPGGWVAELFLGWWVRSRLDEMFRYRHEVTKKECEQSLSKF